MTELAVTFDENCNGVNIRGEIRETESTTPKEKDCALLIAQDLNRILRVAAQLASFKHAEEGSAE